jgi:four helix bundle protein
VYKQDNIIQKKSFGFAIEIIKVCKVLVRENDFVISKQLLKSGTSIGANVEEAIAGQSKKDFIAKMAIASKEARETKYWLRLLKESRDADIGITELLKEVEVICNLLTAIVKTSQNNLMNDKL